MIEYNRNEFNDTRLMKKRIAQRLKLNPDNCAGCGPASYNHAHPEINEENSHE